MEEDWDSFEWQGRTQKQVEDSMRGFTYAVILFIILLILGLIFT